jgi:MerR family transcriptional regulator, copper efflux regulator
MLTIGELARAAGVGVETIRFYERRDLVERPHRPLQGFRRYDAGAARRIRFIRHAQELGFSLEEIRELLAIRVDPSTSCADVKAKALAKIDAVQRKLESLERIRNVLLDLTKTCSGEGPTTQCPILDSLDDGANHGIAKGE